ncbi:MAG: DUF4956 domain-containing protein [Chitinophagales bacterium]
MLKFEEYLTQFSNTIHLGEFLVNIIVAALLAMLLSWFYQRFGNAISNRKRFAANFLPLALTTLLIITIVKSSIALSLGLVGALSIVRFRAAIKDPEELTYLFLVIGIGLATGANQPIIALVAISIILLLLFLYKKINGQVRFKSEDAMYVNIHTDEEDLQKITDLLSKHMSYVELKRLDTLEQGLDLSFICKTDSIQQIQAITQALKGLSSNTQVSIIDQPDLIA